MARLRMIPPMFRTTRLHAAAAIALAAVLSSCEVSPPIQQTQRKPTLLSHNGFSPPPNQGLAAVPNIGAVPMVPPPPVYAPSAIVVDIKSGKILYAKDADSRRAVASTQKIITALCVIDAGNLDKPVRIVASDGQCEPTKLGLRAGEVYTRRELLKVLLVKSANDVARALARDVAGSQEAFAARMNQKCSQLGMRNSRFRNPHGLTEPGQYSTARDLAIAAMAAYQNPVIRQFARTKEFTFRFSNGRTTQIGTTNKVLKDLPYCTGLKTGTTNASGRCLVSTGEVEDRSVVVVVLKSNSRNIWSDSTKLLRWALERS